MKVLYSKKNGITNKLSGVNLPVDADEINYDNTESELQSTNVQDAIDEVVDIVADKVDKVTGKGLSTNDYTNEDKAKVGKIDETTTTASGNPISISGLKSNQLAKDPIITLEPIQDLHGQSNPYPAGGGKNLIPLTVEIIKDRNQNGTWSGDTFTPSGSSGTITIITDAANNVTGFKINGTFSNNTAFYLFSGWYGLSKGTSYIINGGSSTASIRLTDNITNTYFDYSGAGVTFTLENDFRTPVGFFYINVGTWSDVIIKPMIRLATETDATFAPYENICPISGYDKIEVLSCGKNLLDESTYQLGDCVHNNTGHAFSQSSKRPYLTAGTKFVLSYNGDSGNASAYIAVSTSSDSDVASQFTPDFIARGFSSSSPIIGTMPTSGYLAISVFDINGDLNVARSMKLMLEIGETATTYEPYKSSTDLTLQLGQTVYGGTLDLKNGVLKVDRGMKSAKWGDWSDRLTQTNTKARALLLDVPSSVNGNSGGTDLVKSNAVSYYYWNGQWDNVHYYIETTNDGNMCFMFLPVDFDDNTVVQVVYPLATPYTIQLTPHEISLLQGINNVSTNADSIKLTYSDGVLATLEDVKQVGESINVLGNVVNYKTPVHMLKIFEHYVNDLYFYLPIWWDIQYGGYIVDSLLVNNSQNNYRYNFTLRWYNGTVDKTYETLNDSPSDNLTFTVLW